AGAAATPPSSKQGPRRGGGQGVALRRPPTGGGPARVVFLPVAVKDISAASDLFRPVYEHSGGLAGFVSLEVSPTLADDTDATIAEAKRLHAAAARPNVLIKVPGTEAGLHAIEELILAGVPINVTLLFSREHYLGAAHAYLRGLEPRGAAAAHPSGAAGS